MKPITFLLISFLLLISIVHSHGQSPIHLQTPTGNLHATLTTPPNSNSSFPVILFIAGSGPTDRNGNNAMMTNNCYQMLAEGLSDNGIAMVRYDKRGVAESKDAAANEEDLRFETYIHDASSWVDLLHEDERFSDIIVIGHSQGSLIGMIAAQSEKVSKYVSIAGPGEPGGKMLKRQLKDQPAFVLDASLPIIDQLEKGELVDDVDPMLNMLFRPSIQPYLISWFRYDPALEIAKLKKPILIIQGSTDIQVALEDAQMLADSNPKAHLNIFDGMNHVMKTAVIDRMKNIETYNQPELPLYEGLLDAILNFIQ